MQRAAAYYTMPNDNLNPQSKGVGLSKVAKGPTRVTAPGSIDQPCTRRPTVM